jgi:general secretion pathway protein G
VTQYSQLPAAAPRNAFAFWALILGISALVLSPIVLGGVFGIVAAVLGIVGLVKPGRKGLAISGLITGIVSMGIAFIAVFFWIGFFFAISGERLNHARTAAAQAQLSNLKTALGVFEVDVGRFPTTAEGLDALRIRPSTLTPAKWQGPYIEKRYLDAWGNPYVYLCPGKKDPAAFDLFSAGPDGVPDTPDDIASR